MSDFPKPHVRSIRNLRSRIDQPLSSAHCAFSWTIATIIFLALTGFLGGPTEGDASESVFSTWSIAHGNFACAYAPIHLISNPKGNPFTLIAPLYPLLTGGLFALFRLGRRVAFPSQHLGVNCAGAYHEIYLWSLRANVVLPTIRLGYVVWPILLIGFITFLRTSEVGRTGWEAVGSVLLALTMPVIMCLIIYFHPQDVLAIGLTLISLAAARRSRWFWAGVFVGFAVCSQQFAILAAAPLVALAPCRERIRFVAGAIAAAAIVDVPFVIATSGGALRTILLGSSRVGSDIVSRGGTVLWEANLHGVWLFLVARVLPIIASFAVAVWVSRQLGSRALDPIPLMSVISLALLFRLVLEVNLFGYYFMAVAVCLIIVELLHHRVRTEVLYWLGLVTLAFTPSSWGYGSLSLIWDPYLTMIFQVGILALGLVSFVLSCSRRQFHPYKVVWITIVLFTCEAKLWDRGVPFLQVPNWLWQVVLVPTALVLLLIPLLEYIRRHPVNTIFAPIDMKRTTK